VHKYPRISGREGQYRLDKATRKHIPENHGTCFMCKQSGAFVRVTVQYTIFRGDDDVFYAHKDCIKGKKEGELLEAISKL